MDDVDELIPLILKCLSFHLRCARKSGFFVFDFHSDEDLYRYITGIDSCFDGTLYQTFIV